MTSLLQLFICTREVYFRYCIILNKSSGWHVYGLLQRSDRKYDEAIKCYRNALKWDKVGFFMILYFFFGGGANMNFGVHS